MEITLSMLGRAWRARRGARATESTLLRTARGEKSWNRLGGPDAAIASDLAASMLGALIAAYRGRTPPPCAHLDILPKAEAWAASLPETALDKEDGLTCLALDDAADVYYAEVERARTFQRLDGSLTKEGHEIQRAATAAYNAERRRILERVRQI